MIPMNDLGPGKYRTTTDQYSNEWKRDCPEFRFIGGAGMDIVLVEHVSPLPSDAYSTLDQRGRRNTLDNTLEPADKDAVQVHAGQMSRHPTA